MPLLGGPQRAHKLKDPTFWFKVSRQGGFQELWSVGSLCLCGLWGPDLTPAFSQILMGSDTTPRPVRCSLPWLPRPGKPKQTQQMACPEGNIFGKMNS